MSAPYFVPIHANETNGVIWPSANESELISRKHKVDQYTFQELAARVSLNNITGKM